MIFTACQWSCGKRVFQSCLPFCSGRSPWSGPLYRVLLPASSTWTSPYKEAPHQTCLKLFNLNVTVKGPPPLPILPDIFKLVYHDVDCRRVSSWHSTEMHFCYLLNRDLLVPRVKNRPSPFRPYPKYKQNLI